MSEYIRPQGLIRYKPYVFTCPRVPLSYIRYYMPDVILRELSGSWLNLNRIVTRITFANLLAFELLMEIVKFHRKDFRLSFNGL